MRLPGRSADGLPRGLDPQQRELALAMQDDQKLHGRFAWLEDDAFRVELVTQLCALLELGESTTAVARAWVGPEDDGPDAAEAPTWTQREEQAQALEELAAALRRHAIRPELFGLGEPALGELTHAVRQGLPTPEVHPDFRRATANADATEITRVLGLLPASVRRRVFGTANRAAISTLMTALFGLLARGQQEDREEQRLRDQRDAERKREAAAELRRQNRSGPLKAMAALGTLVGWLVAAAMLLAGLTLVIVVLLHLFGRS